MQELELFPSDFWEPLKPLGLEGAFWQLNKHTLIDTWIVLIVLLLLIFGIRLALTQRQSIGRHVVVSFIKTFKDLYHQTIPVYKYSYFTFILTLFTFILLCNLSALLPFVEEPTGDLNTTLALALISFIYTQAATIYEQGITGYFKHFIEPVPFLMPLTVVEKLSSIISLALRLFGNIFGGMLLTKIYMMAVGGVLLYEFIGMILGFNLLIMGFFGVFEGFIQAFVFTVLTLTYLSFAVHTEDSHD